VRRHYELRVRNSDQHGNQWGICPRGRCQRPVLRAQLRLLRNGSYARHGYPFRSADLQTYFSTRPDYRPDPGYTDDRLTANDRANIGLAKQRERDLVAIAGGEVRDFQLRSQAGAYRVLHQ
jgi:hypothetical protein